MKTTVSEAEHPLLCEGTRRVKGDLALALMITYKDDHSKLKKVTWEQMGLSRCFMSLFCLLKLWMKTYCGTWATFYPSSSSDTG